MGSEATNRSAIHHQSRRVTRSRQRASCKRLEAPSIDWLPTIALRRPRARHWCCSFAPATQLPTRFHLPAACTERLDPLWYPNAHRVGPRGAMRRLSTSAIDTIREHHHESTELRSTSPTEARRRSSFSLGPSFGEPSETADSSSPFGAQPAEMSRVRGFGCGQIARASTFATTIARGGDFAPARSARTPLVALRAARGLEISPHVIGSALIRRACRTRSAEPAALGNGPYRAASCVPPRRGAHFAAPEVPSIGGMDPIGARPLFSTTCAQAVECWADAFLRSSYCPCL
jgi:hypothetical protein